MRSVTILLGAVISVSCVEAQSPAPITEPLDVCGAVKVGTRAEVLLRGLGRYTKDGLVMGDFTCPVAHGKDFDLPAMIQIEVTSFVSDRVKGTFEKSIDRNDYKGPFVQMLVRGTLSCPAKFSVSKGDDGDIAFGNGFGELGLITCQLKKARVLLVHKLN